LDGPADDAELNRAAHRFLHVNLDPPALHGFLMDLLKDLERRLAGLAICGGSGLVHGADFPAGSLSYVRDVASGRVDVYASLLELRSDHWLHRSLEAEQLLPRQVLVLGPAVRAYSGAASHFPRTWYHLAVSLSLTGEEKAARQREQENERAASARRAERARMEAEESGTHDEKIRRLQARIDKLEQSGGK
jgi:hypothetical protein